MPVITEFPQGRPGPGAAAASGAKRRLAAQTQPAAALAAGEPAVGHAVRAGGFRAEAVDLVLLVALEVALEPEPVRAALPGQDVRGHPVEEPAVVAGDDRAARELQQRVLQRRQRLHV